MKLEYVVHCLVAMLATCWLTSIFRVLKSWRSACCSWFCFC